MLVSARKNGKLQGKVHFSRFIRKWSTGRLITLIGMGLLVGHGWWAWAWLHRKGVHDVCAGGSVL